jgi:ribosome maturation factor RimP
VDLVEKITHAIEPSLDVMGYRVVLIKLADGARRKTLTVMAERKDDVPMGFDDCTEISRAVGALLDVEDPITTAYDLEVSSPGIDRPLTRLADFSRYRGCEAKIETLIPQDGRKRFRGILEGVKGEAVLLTLPDVKETVEIGFSNIRQAKLAVSDTLVAPSPKKEKHKHANT